MWTEGGPESSVTKSLIVIHRVEPFRWSFVDDLSVWEAVSILEIPMSLIRGSPEFEINTFSGLISACQIIYDIYSERTALMSEWMTPISFR